jgi:hypothetical protein
VEVKAERQFARSRPPTFHVRERCVKSCLTLVIMKLNGDISRMRQPTDVRSKYEPLSPFDVHFQQIDLAGAGLLEDLCKSNARDVDRFRRSARPHLKGPGFAVSEFAANDLQSRRLGPNASLHKRHPVPKWF